MAISKPLSLLLSPFLLTPYLSVSAGPVKDIFVLGGQSNMDGGCDVGDGKWNGYVPRPTAGPTHLYFDSPPSGLKVGGVGLVPCAIGGTKARNWARGTGLYNVLGSRVSESQKDSGKARAIWWYQAEGDTVRKHDAEAYGGNFEKLIANLLSDLGIPSRPVIQVAIASGEGHLVEMGEKLSLKST